MREAPIVPLPKGPLRTVISTDAACEVDDQHAIVYALLHPERFQIEGFVGTHFGEAGGPDGAYKSVIEIQTILKKMGLRGKYPVKQGGDPLCYSRRPQESEGADFIIERALREEEKPVYVVGLGASSDIVSAFLKEPAIKENIVVVWHGRTIWPDKAWNFNVYNDLKAAQALFHSELSLIFFDTGTHLYLPYSESEEKVKPNGEIGRYLHQIRLRRPSFQREDKAMFDMGDIGFLVEQGWCKWEKVYAPDIKVDYTYDFTVNNGPIIRVYDVNRAAIFRDFFDRLSAYAAKSS